VDAELLIRAAVLASAASLAACAGMVKSENVDYRAIVASPDRSEADRQTDQRRNPELLLAFTGVRPGMRVLDMGAGGGYSTELLARAVGSGGTVYAQDSQAVSPRATERFESVRKPLRCGTSYACCEPMTIQSLPTCAISI